MMKMKKREKASYHGKDRSRVHVFHKASKEWLGGQVGIVLLKMCLARLKNTLKTLLVPVLYLYFPSGSKTNFGSVLTC